MTYRDEKSWVRIVPAGFELSILPLTCILRYFVLRNPKTRRPVGGKVLLWLAQIPRRRVRVE